MAWGLAGRSQRQMLGKGKSHQVVVWTLSYVSNEVCSFSNFDLENQSGYFCKAVTSGYLTRYKIFNSELTFQYVGHLNKSYEIRGKIFL